MTVPKHMTIKQWLVDIKEGKVGKPRWQRGYVWDRYRVEKLLTSLMRFHPIGTLLTIKHNPEECTFKPIALYNSKIDEDQVKRLVLDGQQRLTSMWLAMNDSYPEYKFFIRMSSNQEISLDNVKEVVAINVNAKRNLHLVEATSQFQENYVPISILGNAELIKKWCLDIHPTNSANFAELNSSVNELSSQFSAIQISFFELQSDISAEDAINIFLESNRSAFHISPFDIAVAEFDDPTSDQGLRELIDVIDIESDQKRRFFGYELDSRRNKIGNDVLKVACLLTDVKPSNGNMIACKTIDCLRNNWDHVIKAFVCTLDFLEREGIPDRKRLPRDIPLRVLPAVYFRCPVNDRNPDFVNLYNRILRAWFWRACITDRYDRQANDRLFEDFGELNELLELGTDTTTIGSSEFGGDNISNTQITSLEHPLKAPTSSSALSKSIFAVTLRGTPYDFASGKAIRIEEIDKKEYHHLFPKNPKKKFQNLSAKRQREILNHPLNFSLVHEGSNKTFANKDPIDYLNERFNKSGVKEAEMRNYLKDSVIPFDELYVESNYQNYKTFIKARGAWVIEAIKRLLQGTDWRPSSL